MLIPPSWGQCCSVLLTKYGESLVGTAPLGSGVAVWACVWGYPGCLPLTPRLTVPSLQTPTPESSLTTLWDEPEVPVSGGPSGDFELPEEETTQPDTANEVVAVGGAAAKPSAPSGTLPKGVRPGPGLLDNAIDSGSSAAQLPQKSILERKEVLVGEAWALDFATWEEL
jgi:hypothetical protein